MDGREATQQRGIRRIDARAFLPHRCPEPLASRDQFRVLYQDLRLG
jgi:hypothetical protein